YVISAERADYLRRFASDLAKDGGRDAAVQWWQDLGESAQQRRLTAEKQLNDAYWGFWRAREFGLHSWSADQVEQWARTQLEAAVRTPGPNTAGNPRDAAAMVTALARYVRAAEQARDVQERIAELEGSGTTPVVRPVTADNSEAATATAEADQGAA